VWSPSALRRRQQETHPCASTSLAMTESRCAAEMEARVLELARAGVDDAEIARQLTAEGHRSPSSAEVLSATVQNRSVASA
jgi:hypothetical protein